MIIMKQLRYSLIIIGLANIVLSFTNCSKSFLERPPTDAVVDANFYQNDDQVLAATALLYSKVWYSYNDRASFSFGDYRGGTLFSAWNDVANVRFNTTAETPENGQAWRSLFNVVGQSNLAIHNIQTYATDAVSPLIKRAAIAEARFMRAAAYRFLVMNWGEVPILTNNMTLLTDTTIQRNTVQSIWRFMTEEMRAAAEDLPETPVRPGRVTKWSAEGMLARFYLTRAGVESQGGVRKQEFLDSAKYYSDRVIRLSGARLLDNYADLFRYPYDDNEESLFSLRWQYTASDWGTSNSWPAYLNSDGAFSNGDAWGMDKSATYWMLSRYEGFTETSPGVLQGRTNDQRLHATFMLPGAYYPELNKAGGGYTKPFATNGSGEGIFNYVSVKKYIVGKAADVDGQAGQARYNHDTYMLRLAEMYLIYAEASLGNSTSTSDATALRYINTVRTRAGVPAIGSIQRHHINNERAKEFAMEGMLWYDMVSMHYYDPQNAYWILNGQNRGLFHARPNQMPNPTSWTITSVPWSIADRAINANSGNFRLPIPSVELNQAPNLRKPAVDYYNK